MESPLNIFLDWIDLESIDWKDLGTLLPAPISSIYFLACCIFLPFFPCRLAHRCLLFPPALKAVLCGQKESVTQFLSDHFSAHRAANHSSATSRTLAAHEEFKGQLASPLSWDQPGDSHIPVPQISAYPFFFSVAP